MLAQQTGTIHGRVTSADGLGLPGVAVAATSSVLPQARQVVSGADGDYRLPLLPPGTYEVSFTLEGMAAVTRSVQVALQQTSTVDVEPVDRRRVRGDRRSSRRRRSSTRRRRSSEPS